MEQRIPQPVAPSTSCAHPRVGRHHPAEPGSSMVGSWAGALANPRHGGGAAAAMLARARGSWHARLAKYLFCNYVHAMNIFLLIEFKCQL